jgi:hypothetical protein
MKIRFSAHVSYEGSKRGPGASHRIALPAHLRTLEGTFRAPGWLRVSINGSVPFFAFARRPLAGGFLFSMSRARLLYELERRVP